MRALTALVVDDSPSMRRQVCQVLAELPGLLVREAADGAEAWRLLAAGRFDILLTDLNMPRLDGLKLVGLVRQGGPRPAMPIVVITTESAGADGRRALDLGADAWLEKPVDPRRLVEVVRALLRRG
jgi:two-component system, chemotaxis family, chemotaxis protein CheY